MLGMEIDGNIRNASYEMIDTEKMNQEEGYQERIHHLEEEKVNAENLDKIIHRLPT